MKRLAGRQAAFVNKQEGRSGALWEDRFKASPIQRDTYLLACCCYVEMNPVRAGMVAGLRQCRWSSYMERTGLDSRGLLDSDLHDLALGEDEITRIQCYQAYLKQGATNKEINLLHTAWARNQLTGNDRFVDEIEKRLGFRTETRARGRPRLNEK